MRVSDWIYIEQPSSYQELFIGVSIYQFRFDLTKQKRSKYSLQFVEKFTPNDFNTIDKYLIFHLCNKNVNWMIHWFHDGHEYHRTYLALLNKIRLVLLCNSLNCIEISESFQFIYEFYSNSFLGNTTVIVRNDNSIQYYRHSLHVTPFKIELMNDCVN